MNNKETHEQEIEVAILNPDELETQEEGIDFSALALDGDLIEALYQEQMQEQQTEEGASDRSKKENTAHEGKYASDRTKRPDQAGGEDTEYSSENGLPETDGAKSSEKADVTEEDLSGKFVLSDVEAPEKIEVPEKIILDEAENPVTEGEDSSGTEAEDAAVQEAAGGRGSRDAAAESMAAEEAAMGSQTADDAAVGSAASEEAAMRSLTAEEAAVETLTADDGILTSEEADTDAGETQEDDAEGGAGQPPKKKKSVVRRILKGVLITFEVLILALIVYVVAIVIQADSTNDLISRLSQSFLGKAVLSAMIQKDYENNVQETVDSEQISTNEGLDVTPYTLEGDYTSFVIFGVDARGDEFDSGTNSDTIIIVTIQNETGRVRMASIYRDTYLQIESNDGGVHYAKANSAYSSGGAVRALNMLNTNFDLALEDYVVVNFAGVADIIDELGGLDITLSEGEVEQLNYHLAGSIYATGLTAEKITSAGLNHLNGVQALTYARIRKTAFTDPETGEEYNNDYGRTKRQQYVITLLAEKAKSATVSELTAIVNRVFSYNTDEEKVIGTTYAFDDIISMIPLALNFTLDGGEGYPDNKTTMVMSDLNGADCVIATDLVSDVTALHEYLYDEEDYSPTAAVRNIAETILERAATYGTSD